MLSTLSILLIEVLSLSMLCSVDIGIATVDLLHDVHPLLGDATDIRYQELTNCDLQMVSN